MAGLSALFLLILSITSVLSKLRLVNEEIDQKLAAYREAAKRKGLTTMPIVNMSVDKMSLINSRMGIMYGLNREGDVYEDKRENSLTLTGRFSIQPFVVETKELSYNGHSGPATLKSSKITADISFTSTNLMKLGYCHTIWTKFQILPFNDYVLYSKDPKFNNKDITEDMNKNLLPKFNKLYETNEYLKILNERFDFCDIILGISHL
uniref:Venom protein family 5 protein 2 n=1 Tax=Platymeris rhadamanthus TaxID=1134088 RepID=A0A6B9L4U9_PLARH|nr:venom protein family 5 protein 2 [Platymeris rhadamanthus]